jgi:hypothetical protein
MDSTVVAPSVVAPEAIYQFPKHIIFFVKVVANTALNALHTRSISNKENYMFWKLVNSFTMKK